MFHQVVKIPLEWNTIAGEERFASVGDADDVDAQLVLFFQCQLLLSDLLQQVAAHGTGSDDEEVQLLVWREEEGVVDDVERLFKVCPGYNAGDVGFSGTLCQCHDTDAVPAECAEELAGDPRYMFHVLTHDGNGSQFILDDDLIDAAHGDLMFKLLVEHLLGSRGILCADTYGGTVFR